VRELRLRLDSQRLRWTRQSGLASSARELTGSATALLFDPDGDGPLTGLPTQRAGDGHLQYQDPTSGTLLDVPCDAGGDCWGIGPVFEGDLVTTLRLDRFTLPGGALMDYGLPWGFSMEVSRWRELTEAEAMR